MTSSKLSDWLQIIGTFGVLAGLILVTLQMKQSTALVRAELRSNADDAWINIDASKQSEIFSQVLAKSIVEPQNLTNAEILELDGYLFTYIDQLLRDSALYRQGISEDSPAALVHGSLHDYFGNKFARVWWAETKWKFDPELVAIIDREMKNVSITQDLDYIERIKAQFGD